MKINIKRAIFYTMYIYIIFKFVIYVNDYITKIIDYLYLGITLFLLFCLNFKKNLKINKSMIILISLFFILLFQIFYNEYGFIDIFKVVIFAYIAFFIFEDDNLKDYFYLPKKDYLYYLVCIYLIYFLITSFFNGTISLNSNSFYLLASGDKNWSGLTIFLFMYFCFKKKYRVGFIISIIYTLLLKCRMTQLCTILFLLIEFMSKNLFVKNCITKISRIKTFGIFSIIILSQLLLIGISYYCTYNIPINSISNYRESIMDSSNAIRVRANVYAANEIIGNSKLLIRGYDNKVREKLGVEDIRDTTTFMGFRLVQPHSLLLNLILRYGIIFSILYLYLISFLLENNISENNVLCFLLYLIMNMILPFLFNTFYLIFILFVLNLSKDRKVEVR